MNVNLKEAETFIPHYHPSRGHIKGRHAEHWHSNNGTCSPADVLLDKEPRQYLPRVILEWGGHRKWKYFTKFPQCKASFPVEIKRTNGESGAGGPFCSGSFPGSYGTLSIRAV